jgi:hypothetical protein
MRETRSKSIRAAYFDKFQSKTATIFAPHGLADDRQIVRAALNSPHRTSI